MADFSIEIQSDQDTVDNLLRYKFVLYAFKASATNILGYPVVWEQTTDYSLRTYLKGCNSYKAFTSMTLNLNPETIVKINTSYPILLGQRLLVQTNAGTSIVQTNGTADWVQIKNQTFRQFTCGISQEKSGGVTPTCALSLFGEMIVMVRPLDEILIAFDSSQWEIGQVISGLSVPSLLVNMSGGTTRTVIYNINRNWRDNVEPWCTRLDAGVNLVPYLVRRN